MRGFSMDNGLIVEIDDDGIGVVADTNPSGVGLASMTCLLYTSPSPRDS